MTEKERGALLDSVVREVVPHPLLDTFHFQLEQTKRARDILSAVRRRERAKMVFATRADVIQMGEV